MTVRSAQLALVERVGGGWQAVYTCPAGHRTIVKWFEVINEHGAAEQALLGVLKSGAASPIIWRNAPSLPDNTALGGGWWFVLNAGDALEVYVPAGASVEVFAAGTELVL